MGEFPAEFQRPSPDRFVTDVNASRRHHLFDHPQAQRKPRIQPEGVADHSCGKTVAGIKVVTRLFHPA